VRYSFRVSRVIAVDWSGARRPVPDDRAYRRTDREVRVRSIRPTSVFKLVGPTQVGPGSVRGMPLLARLRARGFRVWPFEDAAAPLAVEIWPRVLTEAVVKTRRAGRLAYLEGRFPEIGEPLRGVTASTDDAFDAAVSAVAIWRARDELLTLRAEPDYALEGKIWRPRTRLDSSS
jgi:hypothetical protein